MSSIFVGDFQVSNSQRHPSGHPPAVIAMKSMESMKTKADLQEEHAELLKANELCLAKHEDEPSKAREVSAPYPQSFW